MLDWLDTATAKTTPNSAPPEIGHDSGEVRGDSIFPVSRFRETPEIQNREAANPHGYAVFPVSRFSRFQNEGGQEGKGKNGQQADEESDAIPKHLPGLLDAVAAILADGELDHLHTMSNTAPDAVADACRLVLSNTTFPSTEAVSELDGLMIRLCELEPWLAGYLPEMQKARRRMAPAEVAGNLAYFRQAVREAETKAGPPGWGGGGGTSRYESGIR